MTGTDALGPPEVSSRTCVPSRIRGAEAASRASKLPPLARLHLPSVPCLPREKGLWNSYTSLAKDRATLSSVFAFAEQLELVETNPVRGVPVPKGDQRQPIILSDDQYEALLESASKSVEDMLYAYVAVLGEAGLQL